MNSSAVILSIKVCTDKSGASGKGRGGHVLINYDIMNKEFVTMNREGMGWSCLKLRMRGAGGCYVLMIS